MSGRTIINIPQEDRLKFEQQAEEVGLSLQDYMHALAKTGVQVRVDRPTTSTTPFTTPISISVAINTLLNEVPDYAWRVKEVAHDTGQPLSSYVFSHLGLIAERREASYLDYKYIQDTATKDFHASSEEQKMSTCELCSATFTADRLGQRYCSQECGVKARMALIPKRPNPIKREDSEYAPRQKTDGELAVYLAGQRSAAD